ncbi:type III secretion system export apparatus subunit SctT [Pinirhizobacter sp.]|jgi:type III secretion protein T|uniref:type III secretion system export apparatus subunit SctT n=1 Tax=Pinirhizobacter sp. TaxID=2950432 RepID=UPI002F422894
MSDAVAGLWGLTHEATESVHTMALGMARAIPFMAWVPSLDAGTMPMRMLRVAVAFVCIAGIWPRLGATPPIADDIFTFGWRAALEGMVGLALGLVVSLPFHVMHAVGAMLDNQRGATISSSIDPFNGIESSETSSLLHMFAAVLFLAWGGATAVLEALVASYQLLPVGRFELPPLTQSTAIIGQLLAAALRMAAPAMLLMFIMEVFLGVLSRFAQQMNAFSVSLAVKSFVAFLALAFLFGPMAQRHLPWSFDEVDATRLLRDGAP